jgi:hypothetical protein
MMKVNEEQEIRNLDLFGPVTANDVIMVIQVHDRLEHLNLLIDSLSRVSSYPFPFWLKSLFNYFCKTLLIEWLLQ